MQIKISVITSLQITYAPSHSGTLSSLASYSTFWNKNRLKLSQIFDFKNVNSLKNTHYLAEIQWKIKKNQSSCTQKFYNKYIKFRSLTLLCGKNTASKSRIVTVSQCFAYNSKSVVFTIVFWGIWDMRFDLELSLLSICKIAGAGGVSIGYSMLKHKG